MHEFPKRIFLWEGFRGYEADVYKPEESGCDEYVRIDVVDELERTISKLASVAGIDLAELKEDGWVVSADE